MLKKAGPVVAALFLWTSIALCQNNGRFDASFNGGGVFTKQSDGNGIQQSATIGGNFFGTFRWKFKPKSKQSLILNFGHAKDSQIYQTNYDYHVVTGISEYSAAYMYSPFRRGKFQTFVFGGGGILRFNPNSTWLVLPDFIENVPNRVSLNLGAAKQSQVAFLYGGGVDYDLPRGFAFRVQYRGLLYDAPDFKVNTTSGSVVSFYTGSKGHMAEPSIGIVYRF
jgi:hypothetical protein